MKSFKLFILCTALLCMNPVFALDGKSFLERCNTPDIKFNKGFCYGFITATIGFINFCPPPKNTYAEHVDTFIKYGMANPSQMTNDAALVVEIALVEKWPCADNRR